MDADLPTVSVILPTLNSERYLEECLGSLRAQEYPAGRVEVLVIDAGSTDRTIDIAREFEVNRILDNPLRTGEAGKAVGIHAARGELILSVDSDNVIVGKDWLLRMVAPLVADAEVAASQAMRWDYRREDGFVNRYHALVGVGDPVALYVGNYDRYSYLTGRWTDCPHSEDPQDGWLRVVLFPEHVPTMGANGFLFRRALLDVVPVDDYFFDIDFVHKLVQRGHRTVALVDVPIRHYFCDSVATFRRKTRRRVDDFFYFKSKGQRSYPWTSRRRAGLVRFAGSTALTVPLVVDAARGWRRQRDPAWLFHVPACWITLGIYAFGCVRGVVRPRMLNRTDWRQ